MKILIVGAGISGLTLACFLKKHNQFQVDIIDKEKDWSHLGYTIGIWDLGRRILSKLDLEVEFDTMGTQIHSYFLSAKDNKHQLKLYHFEDFYNKYESAYTHVTRSDLHSILEKKAGTCVRFGLNPTTIVEKDSKVNVTFSDGSEGIYDMVVGADGLHSKVRDMIFKNDVVQYTGNRAWYSWIPQKYISPHTALEIVGKNQICNLFDDPKQACMVIIAQEQPKTFDDPTTRLERIRKHFKNFGYPLSEILKDIKSEDFMPTDIAFVNSTDWIKGRVLLIGDAAHAMEPFAGIGASMGMEDAYVLSEELCQLDTVNSLEIEKTLTRYMHRRLPRIKKAQKQTRQRYWWLTTKIPGIPLMRDFFARMIPVRHFTKGFEELLDTQP